VKAQVPAQGILLVKDWGKSKMYQAVCDCTSDECTHTLDIEADEFGVTVNIYTSQYTDFWHKSVEPKYDIDNIWLQEFNWFWTGFWNGLVNRLRLTRDVWFKGHVKYQSTLILNEQMALNYSETLKTAIKDVKEFKNSRKEKSATVKLAEQGDCE
jgi:hypothetical protein